MSGGLPSHPERACVDAFDLAQVMHRDQHDKLGEPYLAHVLRVTARVADDALHLTVALLHDVVEDSTSKSVDTIRVVFGDEVADAVDALTRRSGEEYDDYIERVAQNAVAVRVKLADLEDNLDPDRRRKLQRVDRPAWARLGNRYERAMWRLTGNPLWVAKEGS